MKFDLVTPSKLVASFEAAHVIASGEEGDFGVLPGHAPLISTLRPGSVRVDAKDGTTKTYAVGFGFVDVTPEGVTVLAEDAIAKEDIDAAALKTKLADVEKSIQKLMHDETQVAAYSRAVKEKAVLEAQLSVVSA